MKIGDIRYGFQVISGDHAGEIVTYYTDDYHYPEYFELNSIPFNDSKDYLLSDKEDAINLYKYGFNQDPNDFSYVDGKEYKRPIIPNSLMNNVQIVEVKLTITNKINVNLKG